MAYSEGLDLLKPSLDRFLEQANFKNSWMLILEEDKLGLKKNAVPIGLKEIRGNKQHVARAIFLINRLANNTPFNNKPVARQFIQRGLYIRKIRGDEIIRYFGVVDRLYLEMKEKPSKTTDLASVLTDKLGMTVKTTDIVEEDILEHKTTHLVRFTMKSDTYVGSILVDLTTQAFRDQPQ